MQLKLNGQVVGVERTKKGTGSIVSVLVTEGGSPDLVKVYVSDGGDPLRLPKKGDVLKDYPCRASVDLLFSV